MKEEKAEGTRQKAEGSTNSRRSLPSAFCLLPSVSLHPSSLILHPCSSSSHCHCADRGRHRRGTRCRACARYRTIKIDVPVEWLALFGPTCEAARRKQVAQGNGIKRMTHQQHLVHVVKLHDFM